MFKYNPFTGALDDVGSSGGGAPGSGDMLTTNNLSDLTNKPQALINIGGTTIGINLFKAANPSAITFIRVNANNTVSFLSASDFRTAIGAGTSTFNGDYTTLINKPTLGTSASLDIGTDVNDIVVREAIPSDALKPGIKLFSTGGNTYLTDDGTPGADKEVIIPRVNGTLITTGDTGTVTSTMLSGGIAYSKLSLTGAILNADLAGSIAASKISGTAAVLTGNTFTGLLQFSGTGHAGLKLNNLTTAQKNTLTASAGMIVFDTDLARLQVYNGSAWKSMVRLDGDTMTGALINSTNGAASTPSLTLTGSVYTGGSATTTKPLCLIEPTGTTSTAWSTSGTLFGLNSANGFSGNIFDFKVNNSSVLILAANGGLSALNLLVSNNVIASNFSLSAFGYYAINSDTYLSRAAANVFRLGVDHATTPTTQTIKAHDVTTGTGADLCFNNGKGSVSGGAIKLAVSTTNGAATVIVTVKASGVVNIANLPTSASGLSTGDLWNNSGVLSVA